MWLQSYFSPFFLIEAVSFPKDSSEALEHISPIKSAGFTLKQSTKVLIASASGTFRYSLKQSLPQQRLWQLRSQSWLQSKHGFPHGLLRLSHAQNQRDEWSNLKCDTSMKKYKHSHMSQCWRAILGVGIHTTGADLRAQQKGWKPGEINILTCMPLGRTPMLWLYQNFGLWCRQRQDLALYSLQKGYKEGLRTRKTVKSSLLFNRHLNWNWTRQ